MLTVRGTLVPLDPAAPDRHERGRVVVGDDGLVAAVDLGDRAAVADTGDVVDVGAGWVFPGLVDLHSHLAYNTLPLWTEPSRQRPFWHHDDWPDEPSYEPSISWPAWTLARCAPHALLAWVEAKAVVAGTTAVQGSPGGRGQQDVRLVRAVDDESFGASGDTLLHASTLTAGDETLRRRARDMRAGQSFVYHCAEGQRGSPVTREYEALRAAGGLQDRLVAVHLTAVTDFRAWSASPGGLVWSPFSNLWLYGQTTDVPAARRAGVTVCLGSDWSPSGPPNLLAELKTASVWNREAGWDLTDAELVAMVTANPGDLLARSWPHRAGRLLPGALGDLAVVARRSEDPWSDLVRARERDVQLVVVGGQARYGTVELVRAAGQRLTTAVTVGGQPRRISVPRPGSPGRPWSLRSVRAALNAVRANPAAALEEAQRRRLTATLGPGPQPTVLELDMPGGGGAVAGPPPDPEALVLPPIAALTVTRRWLSSIRGRGFHGGVLDQLARFYR